MRHPTRRWRWIGLMVVLGAVAFGIVRTWVVPALIVGQIRKTYHGRVVVRDWWLGFDSAGVTGVSLAEGDAADSPDWFTADRISTDVSLRSLVRGRFLPTRVEIDRPKVAFRVDAKGQPTTKIPFVPEPAGSAKGGKPPVALPEVVAKGGEITIQQAGRQPMTIAGVDADLKGVDGTERVAVTTDDPTWGQVKVSGRFDPTFKDGVIEITSSPGFVADPEKIKRIPFIPPDVWTNIEPRGPVDARVKITLKADDPKPIRVHTELDLKGTTARLNSLQVTATDATGHVVIDDGLVQIEDLRGNAIDGTIAASGNLDFGQNPPRFDLDVRARGIDVTKAPPSWQLKETGATGKLTGKVNLRATFAPGGAVDLTGTDGEAVIEDGSFQGIPIKSLSLDLKANGGDLQFATDTTTQVDKVALETDPVAPELHRPAPKGAAAPAPAPFEKLTRSDLARPILELLPLIRIASHDEGPIGWAAWLASEAVAFQSEHAGRKGGVLLPKTITTRIALEDVDLKTLVAKAEKFGIKIPIPVAGQFSIQATATIPLGSLRDIRAYAFHGDATLSAASIDHVDLGRLATRIDLADGVIEIKDFRGHLVNRPDGADTNPPAETALPPIAGELPIGGFRAHLRAEISPRGAATVRVEGRDLPLGEVFAPLLPVPTPLSGDLTMHAQAKADLANLADPRTWTLDGRFENRLIRYQGAVLDHASYQARLKDGRIDLTDFDANLAGRPMHASIGLDLAPPYAYTGKVDVVGWEIARVLGFVPGVPRPAPASGTVTAQGEATGSLRPFAVTTQGHAKVDAAKAGPAPLGDLAFRWSTDADGVAISGIEAASFGGKIAGDARIPTGPGKPVDANITLKGIQGAKLSAVLLARGPMSIAGPVDGSVRLKMPLDASTLDADVLVTSPDLTVRQAAGEGIRLAALRVQGHALGKLVDYKVSAEALGGPVRFQGSIPIDANLLRSIANGEFQAVGFRLGEVWQGLGIRGGLAELEGLGAVDSNLRATLDPFKLWTSGNFEFRELHYGGHFPIGGLRGQVYLNPASWRLDDLQGELFGGVATGKAQGSIASGPTRKMGYEFKIDRASLPRMMVGVPSLAHQVEGSGSLHVVGRFDEAVRASVEVRVPRAVVMKLPISDLRFPGELELDPATGFGSFHARHWTTRLAGGSVQGTTWLRLGGDKTFQTDVELTGVDLGIITRLESDSKRPASGKLSAKISLNGPNPANIAKIRGRIDADLDDASLVELPVLREIDRFLGPARGGGLFEDGDLHGTIYNKTLFIEQMTLEGKLVQVHVTGTITFDGGLNLQVLVNTNQIVPQSGLALVNIIPGLGAAIGRGEQVVGRLAAFLQNRLLKLKVTGNVKSPTVGLDAGVAVGDNAVGFFSSVFKMPGNDR